MSTFQPSAHSYGEGSDDTSTGLNLSDLMQEYAPVVSEIITGGDPREKEAKLRSRIQNYKSLRSQSNSRIVRNALAMKINTLQSQLDALSEQAGEERVAVATTQAGKIVTTLAIGGVSLAAIIFLLRRSKK